MYMIEIGQIPTALEKFSMCRQEPNGVLLIERCAQEAKVEVSRLLLAKAEDIKQVTFNIQN